MNKLRTSILWILVLGIIGCTSQRQPDPTAPLIDNLGDHKIEITTDEPLAKRYFNQGLTLAFGFNHEEAARSFREAIRQDQNCAMCYWGLAYVLGPNYNAGMDDAVAAEAYAAAKKAYELKSNTSLKEGLLIEAIRSRYSIDNMDRGKLDQAYADAMKAAIKQIEDDDLYALYAEAIMDLHPWDLYELDGTPKEWTPTILESLNRSLKINPRNPLAHHLFIHATEASNDPGQARRSAEILPGLAPNAGHLVHMPSHTYIRTGDYHLGTMANEKAIQVDSAYIASCNAQGVYPLAIYPHNVHFLAATAAFEGDAKKSIEAAFDLARIVDKEYMNKPGWATLQHYFTIHYNALVKFSQWERILELDKPDLLYPQAIWHYARGMAFAGLDKMELANAELAQLSALSNNPALKEITVWDINSVYELVQIALLVLQAEINYNDGQLDDAISLLYDAVAIEDRLKYNEPPDWFFSVRHTLGEFLLEAGQLEEAEKIYRDDLLKFPRNGYAYHGLWQSMLKQNKIGEAQKVKAQFDKAFLYANIQLKYSRIDPAAREEILLAKSNTIPEEFYAMAICGE